MEGIDLVQNATPNIVGVNQYAMGKFTIEQGSRRLASSASHDGSLESNKKMHKHRTLFRCCRSKSKSEEQIATAADRLGFGLPIDAFAVLTLITLASKELKWLIIEAARFLGVGVNAR